MDPVQPSPKSNQAFPPPAGPRMYQQEVPQSNPLQASPPKKQAPKAPKVKKPKQPMLDEFGFRIVTMDNQDSDEDEDNYVNEGAQEYNDSPILQNLMMSNPNQAEDKEMQIDSATIPVVGKRRQAPPDEKMQDSWRQDLLEEYEQINPSKKKVQRKEARLFVTVSSADPNLFRTMKERKDLDEIVLKLMKHLDKCERKTKIIHPFLK